MDDNAADCFVRFAEWHSLSHQVVGEFSSIHVTLRRSLACAIFIDTQIAEHYRRYFKTSAHRVEGIKHRLLVLLHIFVVSQRQTLQRSQ